MAAHPGVNIDNLDVSPDATTIVFTSRSTFRYDLWTMDTAAGNITNLTADYPQGALNVHQPSWSPSGAEIALIADFEDFKGDLQLYAVAAAGPGAGVRRLTALGSGIDLPSWGPPLAAGGPAPGPGPGPDPGPPPGPVDLLDGDPATTERVEAADPITAAILIARARFTDAGTSAFAVARRPASWVVLSRADAFPDSLAGSALSGWGPMLFTASGALDPATAAEIDRVLGGTGVVYLLGGEAAVSSAVEAELAARGYTPVRLAGPSRVETAIAVADEVRRVFADQGLALLARAFGAPGNESSGWADSVTGGGYAAYAGLPLLLSPGESLHPAVAAWLQADANQAVALLGGTAALSDTVAAEVGPSAVRIAGADRAATAAAIATDLWRIPPDTPDRAYVIINGTHAQGWAFGLAAAGLSADGVAPLLLTTSEVPAATIQLVSACGEPQVDLALIGDATVIDPALQQELDAWDGAAC